MIVVPSGGVLRIVRRTPEIMSRFTQFVAMRDDPLDTHLMGYLVKAFSVIGSPVEMFHG